MNKYAVGLILLWSAVALATPPPPIPNLPPPLFSGQIPVLPPLGPVPPLKRPSVPPTKAELDRFHFSGSAYFTTLGQITAASFGHENFTAENLPGDGASASVTAERRDDVARHDPNIVAESPGAQLSVETNSVSGTVDYTRNVTFDGDPNDQWIEPSVQAIKIGVTDYTSIVSGHLTGTPTTAVSRLRYATTTDRTYFARGEMPMPGGYTHSADPYLATNPYNGGNSPLTMWCSGILHNGIWSVPNAVVLWRSTNGGTVWGVTTIALNSADTDHFLDKPSVGVNWNGNSQLLGNVYVAYTRLYRRNGASAEIHLARVRTILINGVPTVTVDADIVLETGNVANPQVVVSFVNGRVYVIYDQYASQKIRMATVNDSPSTGLSVFRIEDATAARPMITGYNLTGNIRANTVPIARFNGAQNRIYIAWHENEPNAPAGSPRADVWYTYDDLRTDPDPGIWAGERALISTPGIDEFLPGMDVNSAGDTLLTFYTKRNDPVGGRNLMYNNAFRVIAVNGSVQGPYDIPGDTGVVVTYDPTLQPVNSGFLGDYQDVWNWTYGALNIFHSTWIRTYQSDTELSALR